MPKVSVIIPTYNCGKYIAGSIKSVLNQAGPEKEIIVVDDGSTDNTKEVLEPYVNNRIVKCIYQNNQGPGSARNNGIRVSQGAYICFLDADDRLLPGSLSERSNILDRHAYITITFSDYFLSFGEGMPAEGRLASQGFIKHVKEAVSYNEGPMYLLDKRFYYKYITFPTWSIWTGTVMMRKNAVADIGLFRTDTSHAEDAEYWLRVIKKYNAGFIDKPLSVYERGRSSLTNDRENYFRSGIDSRMDILNKELKNTSCPMSIIAILKNKISKEYSEFGRHYLRIFKVSESRKAFVTALRFNRLSYVPYLFLFISFLPVSFQKKLRNLGKMRLGKI